MYTVQCIFTDPFFLYFQDYSFSFSATFELEGGGGIHGGTVKHRCVRPHRSHDRSQVRCVCHTTGPCGTAQVTGHRTQVTDSRQTQVARHTSPHTCHTSQGYTYTFNTRARARARRQAGTRQRTDTEKISTAPAP